MVCFLSIASVSEWGNALFWGTEGEYDNNSETWNAFEVKYPDIEDVCPTDYSLLYQAIDFVATSDDDTFKSQVANTSTFLFL